MNHSKPYKEDGKHILDNPCRCLILQEEHGHLLASAKSGSYHLGILVCVQMNVSTETGYISKCSYKCFGPPQTIIVSEALCKFSEGKNFTQIMNLNNSIAVKIIQKYLELENIRHDTITIVLDSLKSAASCCEDLPQEFTTPIEKQSYNCIENWTSLSQEKKLETIQNIIDENIAHFMEMDGGSIRIVRLIDNTLYISFHGRCKSCPSSFGSTLEAISYIMKSSTYEDLQIVVAS